MLLVAAVGLGSSPAVAPSAGVAVQLPITLSLGVTPAQPEAGTSGELQAEVSSELMSAQRTPTPWLWSATPSVCTLREELADASGANDIPGPGRFGPTHEVVDFLTAGTCTTVAKQIGTTSFTEGDQSYQTERAEIERSVTVVAENTPATVLSKTGHTTTSSKTVEVPAACPGTRLSKCAVSATLTAHGHVVGDATRTLLGSEDKELAVTLDGAFKRLLRTRHKLVVGYTVAARPEALTATLDVHVYEVGGTSVECAGTKCPVKGGIIYVARVGKVGQVQPTGEFLNSMETLSSTETTHHTLHVPPGLYTVPIYVPVVRELLGGTEELIEARKHHDTVFVGTGQTVNVREDILVPST